jgi:hypothetical protein
LIKSGINIIQILKVGKEIKRKQEKVKRGRGFAQLFLFRNKAEVKGEEKR